MNNPLAGFALSVAGAVTVLTLVAGFVPDVSGPEVRRPYTEEAVRAGETSAVTRPLSHIVWNVRGAMADKEPLPSPAASAPRPTLLEVKDGAVSLRTIAGESIMLSEPGGTFLEPLFGSASGEAGETAVASGQRREESIEALAGVLGEPLDFQGLPLRWSVTRQICGLSPEIQEKTEKLLSDWRELTGLPRNLKMRAERYRDTVEKYAGRYKMPPELVYAIIYTESSFNPTLISSQSAHGLMQVVPNTAGGEVHAWLGGSGIPDADILLHPETNIRYGTAYFHLLMTRHLNSIEDPQSREYCAIASYNSGSSAMLKAFGKTHEDAFAAINDMEPDEVREHLLKKLPSRETRSFVKKVLASKDRFSAML